jgi:hypothetical protein
MLARGGVETTRISAQRYIIRTFRREATCNNIIISKDGWEKQQHELGMGEGQLQQHHHAQRWEGGTTAACVLEGSGSAAPTSWHASHDGKVAETTASSRASRVGGAAARAGKGYMLRSTTSEHATTQAGNRGSICWGGRSQSLKSAQRTQRKHVHSCVG